MTKKSKAGYHLPADLIKEVKLAAIEQCCRDSHIVEAALREYLERGGNKMKIKRNECDCGAVTEDWTCVDCGQVRYIGPNCGHVTQPTPVAASKYDGQPVCEDCEEVV